MTLLQDELVEFRLRLDELVISYGYCENDSHFLIFKYC